MSPQWRFIVHLSEQLRALRTPQEIQEVGRRLIGEHLEATRVSYSFIDADEVHLFTSQEPPVQFGKTIVDACRHGETVVVNDVHAEPRLTDVERAQLAACETTALIAVPLIRDDRGVAMLAVQSATPRRWRSDQVALVEVTADRIWTTLEQRRAEAELRENETDGERFHRALTASGAGCWTWDPRTGEAGWDETFRSRFDFTPDEPPSVEKFFSRVHPDDRPRLQASMQQILESADRWENDYRFVFPDGSIRWMQSLGHADRDASGQVTRLTGFELDINERRQAEEAMQARRDEEHDRELRLLLETATQGVVSINPQGNIVTANRAFELMFGWTAGELIGQSIDRMVPSAVREEHVRQRLNYFTTPQPRLGLQLTGERRDGSTFPIEVSLNHVPSSGGGLAFAFITDITERQRAAEALQQRTAELEDRTKQLSQMAWDLTLAEHHAREQIAKTLHDGLQQLLVIAALNLDVHLKREAESGMTPNAVLLDAKHHLAEAISAARSLSRELFPPVLHGSGLPAALSWLANWMHEKYGLEVTVLANPLADSPRSDLRTLLYESARELLFNAFKHAKADEVSLELGLDADQLCLTVTDRGVGFDLAALDDRWKAGQAGWGLFSIRERLTLLGGRCDVESTPGGGTRVRLLAPRGTAKASAEAMPRIVLPPPAPPIATDPRVSQEALRILIVDDHPAVRTALRQMLHERPQLRVIGEGSDGIDAVVQARQLRPDVILMDVMMPHMNGIDATARISAELPEIQVLGLSMQARSETVHAIEEAGAAGFFVKGLDTQRLLDRLLDLHASRAAAPS